MSIKVTYHGHSTFTLDVNGTKVVVDPFFDDNPAATKAAADVEADVILITHGHGDHVADALPIAKRTGAKVISTFEIVGWFEAQGHENGHPQHIGGGFHHDFGHVKLTPALHGSTLPDGTYGGMPAGFLLTIDGKRIYISGDTGLFSDMSLIGRNGIDLAIVCIGDNFTMGPEDSILALEYLKPTAVIPCHYNTWPPIEVDINAWTELVTNQTDAKPIILGIEESHSL